MTARRSVALAPSPSVALPCTITTIRRARRRALRAFGVSFRVTACEPDAAGSRAAAGNAHGALGALAAGQLQPLGIACLDEELEAAGGLAVDVAADAHAALDRPTQRLDARAAEAGREGARAGSRAAAGAVTGAGAAARAGARAAACAGAAARAAARAGATAGATAARTRGRRVDGQRAGRAAVAPSLSVTVRTRTVTLMRLGKVRVIVGFVPELNS